MSRGIVDTLAPVNWWSHQDSTSLLAAFRVSHSPRREHVPWFFLAAGNNGMFGVDVNLKDETTSPFTAVISWTDPTGTPYLLPGGTERGANVLLVAPVALKLPNQKLIPIWTAERVFNSTNITDFASRCIGSSAATPMIAGVAAVLKSANPSLTWLDAFEILLSTASTLGLQPVQLQDNWINVSQGRKYSRAFGFGRPNATAAVLAARNWITIKRKDFFEYEAPTQSSGVLANNTYTSSWTITTGPIGVFKATQCTHARLVVTAAPQITLGDVEFSLTSPAGTTITMLPSYTVDVDGCGFIRPCPSSLPSYTRKPLLTVAFWGEGLAESGTWTATATLKPKGSTFFSFSNWTLVLNGYNNTPRNTIYPSCGEAQIVADGTVVMDYPTLLASTELPSFVSMPTFCEAASNATFLSLSPTLPLWNSGISCGPAAAPPSQAAGITSYSRLRIDRGIGNTSVIVVQDANFSQNAPASQQPIPFGSVCDTAGAGLRELPWLTCAALCWSSTTFVAIVFQVDLRAHACFCQTSC